MQKDRIARFPVDRRAHHRRIVVMLPQLRGAVGKVARVSPRARTIEPVAAETCFEQRVVRGVHDFIFLNCLQHLFVRASDAQGVFQLFV